MTRCLLTMLGTLLLGAASLFAETPKAGAARRPAYEPRLENGVLHWLEPGLTQRQIEALIGPPHLVAPFGEGFVSWQYHLAGDHHDPSHVLVFRIATGRLMSITRAFEPEIRVDPYFPKQTRIAIELSGPGRPAYPVLLRRLPGERVLLAPGVAENGGQAAQLMLSSVEALAVFHPAIAEQLKTRR